MGTISVTDCACVHMCVCTVPEHAGGGNNSLPVPTAGVINPLIYRINPYTGFRNILLRKENNVFYFDSFFLLPPRAS